MTCWKCLVLKVTVLILNIFSCLPPLPFLLWLRTINRFDLQVGSVAFSEEFWSCLVWKLQSWSYKRCWTKLRHSIIKDMRVYKGPSEDPDPQESYISGRGICYTFPFAPSIWPKGIGTLRMDTNSVWRVVESLPPVWQNVYTQFTCICTKWHSTNPSHDWCLSTHVWKLQRQLTKALRYA